MCFLTNNISRLISKTMYYACVIFLYIFFIGAFILILADLSSLHAPFKKKSFELEALLYSLPLLPAGLRRALYFVSLVGHNDVLLLHKTSAPPQCSMRTEWPRALIGWTLIPTVGYVKTGCTRRQAKILRAAMRDLQGAGASSLSQARTGRRDGLPPFLRLWQGQRGLAMSASTAWWRGASWCEGKGKGLVWTGVHVCRDQDFGRFTIILQMGRQRGRRRGVSDGSTN